MTSQYFWTEVLAPFLKVLALSGSLAGLILGFCLLLRTEKTLAYMRYMNRWVSSRRAMKELEVPRHVAPVARGRRLGLGLVLATIGAYALLVLVASFEPDRLVRLLGADPKYSLVAVAVESLRWLLVLGSAVCVIIGLMMALAPRRLEAFEAWSNRWVSSRRALEGVDTMYVPLDNLTAKFPRTSAVLVLALSAAAGLSSVVLLLQR